MSGLPDVHTVGILGYGHVIERAISSPLPVLATFIGIFRKLLLEVVG
jgi:hypothetical protein